MATGYSRSPCLLKGAFVQLGQRFLGPAPNVIVFQYNPETLSRTVTPWEPPSSAATKSPDKEELAQPVDPGESITLKIELDASDDLEQPDLHPVAVVSGVAARIAAIELLLYPDDAVLLGLPVGDIERKEVPVVLFVWGPGRILPVRITSFSVDEQFFSPTLYPLQATVDVGLQVLLPDAIPGDEPAKRLARAAYTSTQAQKKLLAQAHLATSAGSSSGMVAF